MRRKFVCGNWKMNLKRAEGVALAQALTSGLGELSHADVAVCPPFVYLDAVGAVIRGTAIGLGAQNQYAKGPGAFTGEIWGGMLVDLGCRYVILGHSERRQLFHESDDEILAKTKAALEVGLTPIVCLGETLAERESGQTMSVIRGQFQGSCATLSAEQFAQVVLAYEPVWAIGTGKVATAAQAEEVHLDLRNSVKSRYNPAIADETRILYGGSVNAKNAAELFAAANIDGALVGGASLKADDFLGILRAANGA